jgi:hypothetical protein
MREMLALQAPNWGVSAQPRSRRSPAGGFPAPATAFLPGHSLSMRSSAHEVSCRCTDQQLEFLTNANVGEVW